MNAIEQGLLRLGQELCRAHVGREHHFFDKLVRFVPHCGLDVGYAAIVVEGEARLLAFKIQRAA